MPAIKFLQPDKTAEVASAHYEFMRKLWNLDGNTPNLRTELLEHTSGNKLRDMLKNSHGIVIAPEELDVQVLLVDVTNGDLKRLPAKPDAEFDPAQDFYVLVVPPAPAVPGKAHADWQAWVEASFHAANDAYGM